MSEVDIFHDSQAERDSEEEEVIFREDNPRVEHSTPPSMITANDLDIVIEGWERKFEHLSQCMREIQLASEKANINMNNIVKESRAREGIQERRIEEMHVGLTQFLERCDHTPLTPTGVPSRLRPDFDFESPVNQATPTESTRNNIDPHNIDPRNRDHHGARESTCNNIDPRNRDHHDARDRSRDHRSHERPTHEDDRGDSSDAQRNSYHSGMSNLMSRPSSSPKVPTFDGTVSAQFRPWIIQFEAIARHQCWTLGERVVRLVASPMGPAANLLIGMTMGQLDDYPFLVACLSRRYDPPRAGRSTPCRVARTHQTPKRNR